MNVKFPADVNASPMILRQPLTSSYLSLAARQVPQTFSKQQLPAEDFPERRVVMDTSQSAGGCPVLEQTDVQTWLPPNRRANGNTCKEKWQAKHLAESLIPRLADCGSTNLSGLVNLGHPLSIPPGESFIVVIGRHDIACYGLPDTRSTLSAPSALTQVASVWRDQLKALCHQPALTILESLNKMMGDNVDVKALRARFSSSTSASHTSSRESNSPKSPRRGVGRGMPPTPEKDIFRPRMSPAVLPHVADPDVATVAPTQAEPVLFSHSPSHTGVREVVQSSRGNKIKQTGEMLENLMLRRAAGTRVPLPAPRLTALPPPRLRSAINVIPLRKPLPPDGPLPLKPKRPHNVDLEQFFNIAQRARPLPASGTREGSETRHISLSGVTSTPNPPSEPINYSGLQNQVTSVEVDIYHDDYDDIANLEDQDDYDDLSSEDFPPPPPPPPPDISVDAIVEKELRKKFKYEGPLRALQTVMINPNGVMKKPGRKDLHVSPGDVVDIIQLTNSKKALCHNRRSGECGYVSRKLLVRLEEDFYDHYVSEPHDNDYEDTDY